MPQHCPDAQRFLDEMTAELHRNGADLAFTAAERQLLSQVAERQLLSQVADAMDRRHELAALYSAAEGTTLKVKLAGEIRLTDGAIERMLRRVSTSVPAPESQRTIKARAAANTRWSMTPI
jgi:hypothetical protein